MNIDKRLVRKDSLEKLFDILKQNSKTIYAPSTKNGKITFKTAENFAAITTGLYSDNRVIEGYRIPPRRKAS